MAYLILWLKWAITQHPTETLLVALGLGWYYHKSSQGRKP